MSPLEDFAAGIWIASGPVVRSFGFHYPTRMAVLRLQGGALFVWSPIALTDDLKRAVDGLGTVEHIVAPNSLHHVAMSGWISAYPNAKAYAAPGLPEKRNDISFHAVLTKDAPACWDGQIDQTPVRGNLITTEVVFFHRQSGTVIFTDLLQQFRPDWFTGWRAVAAWLDGMTAPEPQVPRKFRLAFSNRAIAREDMHRIAAWPIERVLMAHGPPVLTDGSALVGRAFAWLF